MVSLIRYALLTKGPFHTRLALLSLYCVIGLFLTLFFVFFSLPPGPASAMESRMARSLVGYGSYLVALLGLALVAWLSSIAAYVWDGFKNPGLDAVGLAVVLAPPVTVALGQVVYGAFLQGRGVAIHKFLYSLPPPW